MQSTSVLTTIIYLTGSRKGRHLLADLKISRCTFGIDNCHQIFSCGEALKKNKELITEEQIPYQKELRKNYKALQEQLDPLLKNRFGTLRGSMGMRKK